MKFRGELLIASVIFCAPLQAEELWECLDEGSSEWVVTTSAVRSAKKTCRAADYSRASFQSLSVEEFSNYQRGLESELEQQSSKDSSLQASARRFLWRKKQILPGPLPSSAPKKQYCLVSGEIRTEHSKNARIELLRDKRIMKKLDILTQAFLWPLHWSLFHEGSCDGLSARILYLEQRK